MTSALAERSEMERFTPKGVAAVTASFNGRRSVPDIEDDLSKNEILERRYEAEGLNLSMTNILDKMWNIQLEYSHWRV